MSIIIYTLTIIIILYALYYYHNMKDIEKFLSKSATNNMNKSNISTESTGSNDVMIKLRQQIDEIKSKLPNNKNITSGTINDSSFTNLLREQITRLNKVQSANFNELNKKKSEHLTELKTKLNNFREQLEMESGRDPTMILSVTSHQNGQPLSVLPVTNNKHVVMFNNKCLSSNSVGNYDLKDCNYQDINQQFTLTPVYHDIDYNSQLNGSVPKVNITDNNDKKIKYPFMMIKSATSGNCVANEDSKVYVTQCKGEENQRWHGSTSLYKCAKSS